MATLGELPEKERKELVRALAREIWLGVEDQGELPISLKEGVAMVVEKSGLLHESNFYGDGFNAAQVAKLEEFREHRNQGFDIAEVYDKCIVDVEEMAPGFARKSDDLRRMWGMLHIMRELCKADSPFATLRTADAVEDRDRSDESNDENEDDEESDEGEEEQDSGSDSGSDSDSDNEANKVLDKADEEDAEDSSDSDSDSDSDSASGELPPKRKKLDRAAAQSRSPEPPSPARTGDDDSDLGDA